MSSALEAVCLDTPNVVQLVEARLAKIVGAATYPHLRNALQESGGVLTGSFVLQCIIGESWPDSDIDVFIPVNPGFVTPYNSQTSPLDNWLYSQGAVLKDSIRPTFTSAGRYVDLLVGTEEKKLAAIRDYAFCNKTFQLIHMTRTTSEAVCDFVCTDFDFSIVKNTFYIDKSGQPHWSVSDWNGIGARRCAFTVNQNIRSSLWRRHKYQERGFEIYCHDPWAVLLKQVQLHNRRMFYNVQFVDEVLRINLKTDWGLQQFRKQSLQIGTRRYRQCEDPRCPYNELSSWHLHNISFEVFIPIGRSICRDYIVVHPDTFRLDRAVEVLITLQNLRFPTLVLCHLLEFLDCNADFCAPKTLWQLVSLIRHFKEKAAQNSISNTSTKSICN